MIGWFLVAVLAGLALFVSAWWWIPGLLLALWKAGKWHFYSSRPWKKVHYPMMRAYAAAAGLESANAKNSNSEYNLDRALTFLLKTTQPNWTEEKIRTVLAREKQRCIDFSDRTLLVDYMMRKNSSLAREKAEEVVGNCRKFFKPSEKAMMVRLVVAAVIEELYGEADRGEYIAEVLVGNAK